jgi:hypothetical protein
MKNLSALDTPVHAASLMLTQVQGNHFSMGEAPLQTRPEFALVGFALTHVRQSPVDQAPCSFGREALAAPRSRSCRAAIGGYWLLVLP